MGFLSWLFGRAPQLTHKVLDDYQMFGTDVWRVTLPLNWAVHPKSGDAIYLESSDGAKGLYILAFDFAAKGSPGAEEIAKQIHEASRLMLIGMDGYSWVILHDRHTQAGRGQIALLDAYDSQKCYRICTKTVVCLPFALRAAFHDYDCEDLSASQAYFEPALASVQLNGARF